MYSATQTRQPRQPEMLRLCKAASDRKNAQLMARNAGYMQETEFAVACFKKKQQTQRQVRQLDKGIAPYRQATTRINNLLAT